MASILSERQDGHGYHYGFREGDHRQINVRLEEGPDHPETYWCGWVAYVGGERIPNEYGSKNAAEAAAIAWAEANPPTE